MKTKTLNQSQSERIRFIRVYRNISQEYIASCLNLSQSAYSKIETGQRKLNIERVEKLAKVFNLELSLFLLYLSGHIHNSDIIKEL